MLKKIYNLRHLVPGFTGHWGPIGFENGIGSTNSKRDRDLLVEKLGCKDITTKDKETKKKNKL